MVRNIFKEQVPAATSGISSAKNATSQPIMFPKGSSSRGQHAQVFPTLNQLQESPRGSGSKGNSQKQPL